MVGGFQAHAVALDGAHHLVDGLVLGYDGALQLGGHALQADALLLGHALHGHAGHHRNHVGHLLLGHRLALAAVAVLPFPVKLLKLPLKHQLAVPVAGCQLVVLILDGFLLVLFNTGYLLLLLCDLGRYLDVAEMYARAYLVHSVDGLVGHEAVGDIAVCQFDTCCQSVVGIADMMVVLVAVLDVAEYLERLVVGGWLDLHLLEAALQGAVFLDGVAVFVERCGADTLHVAACQRRLHDVGSIHGARGRAGAYDGVDFVDEYDDILVLLKLLHQLLQALFKLPAILRAGHDARHVERVDALAEEHWRRVVLGNHLCQSLDDGTLADARFANQYGVVLLAAAQNLDDALNLALTADAGV